MEKQQFVDVYLRYHIWMEGLESSAFSIHESVNQKYDRRLPYGFHLKLTASYVSRYGYLVAESEADVLALYGAAYLHDVMEDARMTFNDVVKFVKVFEVEGVTLPEECRQAFEHHVPEIVYALTNEKGRNRKERANDPYYKGIRETRFASFVKMCDRLANIRYTTLFVFTNPMLKVYRDEYDEFIKAIGKGAVTQIPPEMEQEALEMLREETYAIE